MPTKYKSPGVYVEEVPAAVQAIAGVGTSTAGFIGLVADNVTMPVLPGVTPADPNNPTADETYSVATAGEPQLVTNWTEFKNKFGDAQEGNKILAEAVYGFLNNGGTRCWVTRVTNLQEDTSSDPAVDQVENALTSLEGIDEVALVAIPMPGDLGTDSSDAAATLARRVAIRTSMLNHCEKMLDRFAILDGEETIDGNLVPRAIYPNAAGDTTGTASTYGAVYFPFIDISGTGDYVPPSGHIAGIYARVDGERGVHKAPANAAIRGALGLKYRISRPQQDGLNPDGINVIRAFNGTIKVWGARTLADESSREFTYINVRRTFNFIRESIDEGLQWAVFEPNTPDLWQKITRNVTAFLTNVWRSGALFGTTPQEAFYVKCDAETNPPELRELGQVVTEIGIAPVRPAEFVIFRISQFTTPS
jgi:hypothetical protein